jgi:hypothetical protein
MVVQPSLPPGPGQQRPCPLRPKSTTEALPPLLLPCPNASHPATMPSLATAPPIPAPPRPTGRATQQHCRPHQASGSVGSQGHTSSRGYTHSLITMPTAGSTRRQHTQSLHRRQHQRRLPDREHRRGEVHNIHKNSQPNHSTTPPKHKHGPAPASHEPTHARPSHSITPPRRRRAARWAA